MIHIVPLIVAFMFAPLLMGVVNRTKAWFAGRTGQPLVQMYYDIWRLLHKGAVYSKSTTALIWVGPVVVLATTIAALSFLPLGNIGSFISFSGDIILIAYVLALGRFFLMLGALDTGSAFEGMGASREAFFSLLAEIALFLSLIFLSVASGDRSLSGMLAATSHFPQSAVVPLMLVCAGLFIVLLVENARIPFDDPNTHLELTMIHEVMVLDHSGPDFAFIQYASALKLWLFSSLLANLFVPLVFGVASPAMVLVSIFLLGVAVGVVESTMARSRLRQVPNLIIGAWTLCFLGFLLFVISPK